MNSFGEKNGMKTNLKFTFEMGKSVPFLDTLVSVNGEGLKTTLYSKPTDAHLYLRKSSCHPPSCTKGIVKGELLRARRICTLKEDFVKAAGKVMPFMSKKNAGGQQGESSVLADASTTVKPMAAKATNIAETAVATSLVAVPTAVKAAPALGILGSATAGIMMLTQDITFPSAMMDILSCAGIEVAGGGIAFDRSVRVFSSKALSKPRTKCV